MARGGRARRARRARVVTGSSRGRAAVLSPVVLTSGCLWSSRSDRRPQRNLNACPRRQAHHVQGGDFPIVLARSSPATPGVRARLLARGAGCSDGGIQGAVARLGVRARGHADARGESALATRRGDHDRLLATARSEVPAGLAVPRMPTTRAPKRTTCRSSRTGSLISHSGRRAGLLRVCERRRPGSAATRGVAGR